jgi:protein-disulfide isomerase
MSDGPFGLTPSGSTPGEPGEPDRAPVPAEVFGFGSGDPSAADPAATPAIAAGPPPSPTEPVSAREGARERAREIRELHRKQDRRRRGIVIGSIAGAIVAIVAIVAVVLAFSQPTGRGPLNMLSDGIKIGAGYKAVTTPGVPVNSRPIPSATNAPGVIDIKLYVDYLCPNCGVFEKNNDAQLRAWIKSGAATVEIHPLAVLTTKSAGTQYSMRAANAAACVAEFSPDHFFEFNEALFVDQPKEGTPGLDDTTLGDRAAKAGVTDLARVRACIQDHRFRNWVQSATTRALSGPIPNSDLKAIAGTPTIIVNGSQFKYTTAFDPNEFAQFVQQVAGDTFTKNPTQTPTPTPSASSTAG